MEVGIERLSKKRTCKAEDDQLRIVMESLPHDIILNILSRLPITSLVQFSYVSRAWNTLSYNPNLVQLHHSLAANKNPCLILHGDYPIRNQLHFVELSDLPGNEIVRKIQTPFLEVLPEFHILASCNGLLCLSNSLYGDPLYIYNPFTRKHKELPKSRQYDDQEVVFGFGFNPMKSEYKVVRIVFYWIHWNQFVLPPVRRRLRIYGPTGSDVQVYTLGEPKWRSIGNVTHRLEGRASETLVNGRIHWLTQAEIILDHPIHYIRRIISFGLADEQFQEVPRPECGGLDRCNYHLAVLGGCLSAAVCSHQGKFEIWVMKMYGVQESWIKQFYIQDHSPLFIKPQLKRPRQIWRNVLSQRPVRVLCLLKNGTVLIEYKSGVLVCHDPVSGNFKKLIFRGLPDFFQTVVHVGSLNWINTPVHTAKET